MVDKEFDKMFWNKHFKNLEAEFLECYQTVGNKSMGEALHKFLVRTDFGRYQRNRHYLMLLGQSERLSAMSDTQVIQLPNGRSKVEKTELPGMVYGMIYNAWSKLKDDMEADALKGATRCPQCGSQAGFTPDYDDPQYMTCKNCDWSYTNGD